MSQLSSVTLLSLSLQFTMLQTHNYNVYFNSSASLNVIGSTPNKSGSFNLTMY